MYVVGVLLPYWVGELGIPKLETRETIPGEGFCNSRALVEHKNRLLLKYKYSCLRNHVVLVSHLSDSLTRIFFGTIIVARCVRRV